METQNTDEVQAVVAELAAQYWSDLAADGRRDTADNRAGWLWFTCPAQHRDAVAAAIARAHD